MYRIEIISNKSVEDDITQALEKSVENILWTKFPVVYGKGKNNKKLGNSTWPEKNFVLVSYIEDDDYKKITTAIEEIKKKFSNEGIKLFAIKSS